MTSVGFRTSAFSILSLIALLANADSPQWNTSSSAEERFTTTASYLAAPELEGRGVGTAGLILAEKYVERVFTEQGLTPFAPTENHEPSFEHTIQVLTGVQVKDAFLYSGSSASMDKDFAPASMSASASFNGELINLGFGTKIPEMNWDDYANVDLAGKVALIKRHLPDNTLSTDKQKQYSDLFYKINLARDKGAVAVIFWIDDERGGDTLPELNRQYRMSAIPVLHATRTLVQSWIQSQAPVQIQGNITLQKTFSPAHNIVGSLGGACSTPSRAILIGAHLDHLGLGDESSLEPTKKGLHGGADDNASGVAAMLETILRIKNQWSSEALQDRCFVFAAFAAEEQGLVGSTALVASWRKAQWKPKAMLNLDMVGRLRENNVGVFASNSAQEWPTLLIPQCESANLKCTVQTEDGLGRSDHVAFLIAGIPSLFFNTGAHADYHRTTDTADKLNADGAVRIAAVAASVASLASDPSIKMTYVAPPQDTTGGDLPTWGAYLGTMPDYTGGSPDLKGVLLTGAVPGSPAEKAGVQPGDVLLAIDSHSTPTIDDFMLVLRTLRPGDRIVLRILRGSETLALPTVVGSRRR